MELTIGPFRKTFREGNWCGTIAWIFIYTELDMEYY